MTLTSKPLAILIVVSMFGGIFFSDLMGWWQNKNSGQGGRYGQEWGAREEPAGTIEGSEHSDSGDRIIRGRTTFGELIQWGLTQAQIEAVLGVEMPSNPAVVIRDYCTEKGLSFGQVKAGLQAELDG